MDKFLHRVLIVGNKDPRETIYHLRVVSLKVMDKRFYFKEANSLMCKFKV